MADEKDGLSEINPIALVTWFLNTKRLELSPKTFRLYRTSLMTLIEVSYGHDSEKQQTATDLLAKSRSVKIGNIIERHGLRTSQQKSKQVLLSDFAILKETASKSKSKSFPIALAFLYSTIMTGFRPQEWLRTEIVHFDGSNIDGLRFGIKAKTLKGGAEANAITKTKLPYRIIPIPLNDDISEKEIHTIQYCVDYCRKFRLKSLEVAVSSGNSDKSEEFATAQWRNRLQEFQRALREINDLAFRARRLNPKNGRITLYSARHQFKTNSKGILECGGISPGEVEYLIAVLMGHNNPATQRGYGVKGSKGVNVKVIHRLEELSESAKYIAQFVENVKA
jgi:hypothetical protein